MTLLREYVVAVRSLLAGRTVTAEGRYVRLHEVRLGWVPTPTPAVHVGAVRPKTITLAGELGDGIVLTGETGVSELAAARAGYDAARGDRPGRVTVYVPAESTDESDAAGLASTVADYAAAGADAVILEPVPGADPLRFARFAAEQVRPRLG
jgi:alkanesulfonate monooxygenase SsuD/methylene tetrahydromethanopterin reductase-like flavin-dependent oxidoreductase (luciferase family)